MKDDKQPDIETGMNPFALDDAIVAGATRIEAPEFSHMSTTSEVPEMASLRIEYVARQETLIGESVATYLQSFRNVKLTPEEAIQRVTKELAQACMPLTLQVVSNYSPRDGIALNPTGRFMHPEAQQAQPQSRSVIQRPN